MTSSSDSPKIHKGLVSTIIPVFNRPKMVKEAIASVRGQSYQSVEIIVVDDGSDDKTASILKGIQKTNREVTVLHQSTQGFGVARQRGLDHAQGEYIQFLDCDDLLLPEKFKLQIAALKSDKKAVAAYGKTEFLEAGWKPKNISWKRTGEKIETMFPLFLHERWWATSTPLYRHKALRKLGPILPITSEEAWEFDCRLAARGGRLAYVDEFVSHQRKQDDPADDDATDKLKLADRCEAKTGMYRSARKAKELIGLEDMQYFSRSTFQLARECAVAGMSSQVHDMLRLSIKANKGPSREHQLFVKTGNFVGWRVAGCLAKAYERVKS